MRSWGLGLAVVAAALACAAGASAGSQPLNFADAPGDSGTAPDILRVSASLDDQGRYVFFVLFATPFGPTSGLTFGINADKKSTGDGNGSDFELTSGQGLLAWNATAAAWAPAADQSGVSFTTAADGLSATATVAKSALAGTSAFTVVITSLDGAGGAGHQDVAVGQWTNTPDTFSLSVGAAIASSAQAGGTWSLLMSANRSDTNEPLASGTVTCSATAGGKRLAVKTSFAHSTAICHVQIPKTLHHANVRATLTIAAGGAKVSHTFTASVK